MYVCMCVCTAVWQSSKHMMEPWFPLGFVQAVSWLRASLCGVCVCVCVCLPVCLSGRGSFWRPLGAHFRGRSVKGLILAPPQGRIPGLMLAPLWGRSGLILAALGGSFSRSVCQGAHFGTPSGPHPRPDVATPLGPLGAHFGAPWGADFRTRSGRGLILAPLHGLILAPLLGLIFALGPARGSFWRPFGGLLLALGPPRA